MATPTRQPNVCRVIAEREVTGRRSFRPILHRRSCSLRQVLRQEDGGVLLGFSSDGNFLVYSIWRDSHYEVQWRRVDFGDFEQWREGGEPPETKLKLCVDGGSSAYGVSTPLQVWQSSDHSLVMAITTECLTDSQESSRLCRLVVAPSPVFDDGGRATAVASLNFQFSINALSQKLEKRQLAQLVRGPGAPRNVYHMLVNAGTFVHILVFHAWIRGFKTGIDENSATGWLDETTPRGLGISHFVQNSWYYPPDFPTKFQEVTEQTRRDIDSGATVGVQCLCEHIFDVECFLGEFLGSFKPLQHYNLVDYDLQLVRIHSAERTVFMICVMALTPSKIQLVTAGAPQLRVALFVSLQLFSGVQHIIRALKVPGKDDLRRVSQVVAQRFLGDLNARLPPEPTPTMWNNEAFLREESLQAIHNPVYPLSIFND